MIQNKKIRKIKGQITIFVALVFFVLFTIFGMTISMGMFIHDKINLQNATDLASYYVATKQAEMLTAIAHSNYQIRQSWKLAAFRYRVFSNGARTEKFPKDYRHPALYNSDIAANAGNHSEKYTPAFEYTNTAGVVLPPRVCIGGSHMFKEFSGDNYCKTMSFSVSYIRPVSSIASIPNVGDTNTVINETNNQIGRSCSATAYANWWFANTIVGAHKLEQRDRRALIEALAKNLMQPIAPGGMKDLDGEDVYTGALKTFRFNLSESNREEINEARIEFTNSLEKYTDVSAWLAPILAHVVIPFSLLKATAGDCHEELRVHEDSQDLINLMSLPNGAQARALQAGLDPDTKIGDLGFTGKHDADSLMNISLGVEKNPWIMVYNRAVGGAASKPLFMMNILGKEINIRAVSYAKPFGGRIGPWHGTRWSKGSPESDRSSPPTDPLLPRRVSLAELGTLGSDQKKNEKNLRPNYSRYPGDEDGLTTKAAMVAYGKIVGWGAYNPNVNNVQTSLSHFNRATYSYNNNTLYNDPLAQNIGNVDPTDSFVRRLEIAAIAPDAFDMYYYSIVPGFYDYFVKDKLDKNWLGIDDDKYKIRGDIGSSEDNKAFDIKDQFNIEEPGYDRSRKAPWLKTSEDPQVTMLTSWLSGTAVMNYGPADDPGIKDKFARCESKNRAKPEVLIPSECAHGGRVGYSVKLVSRKYIESSKHSLGGSTGQIENVVEKYVTPEDP